MPSYNFAAWDNSHRIGDLEWRYHPTYTDVLMVRNHGAHIVDLHRDGIVGSVHIARNPTQEYCAPRLLVRVWGNTEHDTNAHSNTHNLLGPGQTYAMYSSQGLKIVSGDAGPTLQHRQVGDDGATERTGLPANLTVGSEWDNSIRLHAGVEVVLISARSSGLTPYIGHWGSTLGGVIASGVHGSNGPGWTMSNEVGVRFRVLAVRRYEPPAPPPPPPEATAIAALAPVGTFAAPGEIQVRQGARLRRHWQRMGVELEGGYNAHPENYLTRNGVVQSPGTWTGGARVHVGSDGSVNTGAPYDGREVRVGPYMRFRDCASTVLALYPDVTNHTCGLHVHVSFRMGDFTRLMSPAFHEHFLGRWREWGTRMGIRTDHPFWNRLEGCQYTQRNQASDFARGINHDRYRQLNYSAYRVHKTLECRMLPAFHDKRLAVLAINFLLQIYEDYLTSLDMAASATPEHSLDVNMTMETFTANTERQVDGDTVVDNRSREVDPHPELGRPTPPGVRRYWITQDVTSDEDAFRAALNL